MTNSRQFEAFNYCLNKAKQSKSSFYTSFAYFAKEKRNAVATVYAFCRDVDDIADGSLGLEQKKTALHEWHEKIAKLHKYSASYLETALYHTIEKYSIPKKYFHELIHGMEMDLGKTRYANYQELYNYCYHAASTVGLITTYITGFKDKKTLMFAEKLGMALQMINIVRDVKEDALKGRIYLPKTLLDEFAIKEQQLLDLHFNINLKNCLANFSAKARANYHQALALLPDIDREQQTVSLIMGRVYYELLNKISAKDFQVFNKTIKLSRSKKLLTAWRAWRKEKKRLKVHG